VVAVLKRVLGILLENILDLLLPVDNGRFKDVGLVLTRSAFTVGDVLGRQR